MKENKQSYFKKTTTIYVGNLSYSVTEESLEKMFLNYGKVSYIDLVRERKSGKKKGIAFIKMYKKDQALKAIDDLDQKVYRGRTLKVSLAIENNPDQVKKPIGRQFRKKAVKKT